MPSEDDLIVAGESMAAFYASDYRTARDLLRKIKQQRENDPKVLHNEAIAEYVEGGMREPRKLLNALEALKQRLEDARSESEFGESDALGDADPSLVAYNMAVLSYQLKQYARCRTLLEDMFSNIEPIDEFLAFKLCFLLLDVYLIMRQADRAAEVLTYLEKSFSTLTRADGAGGKENGLSAADGAADGACSGGAAAGGGVAGADEWPSKRSTRRPPTLISPDEVRSSLSLYKAKLALMARSAKSSKREIKTTLNACAPTTSGLLLKAELEWQRSNFRKAIKLLNNSCHKSERDLNVPAIFFNNMGCIHHCMRRHAAAAFYFTRALHENELLCKPPSDAAAIGERVPLPTFSCDRRCELEYNRGLQFLLSGRPEAAFDAFLVALQLFHSLPRAWLRIGEACVAVHCKQQQAALRSAGVASVSPLVSAIASGPRNNSAPAGTAASRYLVMPTDGPLAAGKLDPTATAAEDAVAPDTAPASTVGSPAAAAPTLAYGVKAFNNAVLLCGQQCSAMPLASVSAADYATMLASSANGTLSAADEAILGLHGVHRLALLQLSWCALEAQDYLPAHSWAAQLLGLDACPPSLRAYAHLYACDALTHLGRIPEAMETLQRALELSEPLVPVVSSTGADTSAADGEGIESVRNHYSTIGGGGAVGGGAADDARATLLTNLAVVHVVQGECKVAEGFVQQALAAKPDCRQALLCCIYLELRGGRVESAVDLLKKQRLPKPK